MRIGCIVLICALGLFAAALLIHLLLLRHSITEVARGLEDKLNTDTNTLISISSGDRAVCARKRRGQKHNDRMYTWR